MKTGSGSTDMKVSVVVPAFKMGAFLGEALESVHMQTHKFWEVVVVDDAGPEDGTKRIVEDFSRRHPDGRIKYLRHATNQGVSAARNTGIAASTGELLAFLDPDDVWLPEYLQRMTGVFSDKPVISLVNARVLLFGDNLPVERAYLLQPWEIECFPSSLAVSNFIAPSATVLRRSAMEKVGGFDTAPEIQHAEDYDLWIRLVEAGCEFVLLNDILVRYRKHPGAASDDPGRMRQLERVIVQKHGLFMNLALRQLVLNLHSRHEGLKGLVKNPFKRFWEKLAS